MLSLIGCDDRGKLRRGGWLIAAIADQRGGPVPEQPNQEQQPDDRQGDAQIVRPVALLGLVAHRALLARSSLALARRPSAHLQRARNRLQTLRAAASRANLGYASRPNERSSHRAAAAALPVGSSMRSISQSSVAASTGWLS